MLRRLAAVLGSSDGAALLTDRHGVVVRLQAEPPRRRALAERAIAEGRTLFEPPAEVPSGSAGVSNPAIADDLSCAVAPVRAREAIRAFACVLVPAAGAAPFSILCAAADLAAHAIEEAHRAELETEDAARERANLHGVIESAPDSIVLLDGAGRILGANPLAVRLLGARLETGSVLGDVLLDSGILDREGAEALRTIETGSVAAAEVRVGGGTRGRPYLVEASPIRHGGKISARVIRFRSQQDAARVAAGSRSLVDAERRTLVLALEETRWNISETARRLGVTRPTVYSMIRRHRVSPGSR